MSDHVKPTPAQGVLLDPGSAFLQVSPEHHDDTAVPVQLQERRAFCPIADRLESRARRQREESLWAVASLAHHNGGLAKKIVTVSRHENSLSGRCGAAKAD